MQESFDSKTPTSPSTPKVVTLDLETTGLDWQNDSIILCGYRVNQGEIRYAEGEDKELSDLLSCPENTLRGHNVKFDALFLSHLGYDIRCNLQDTRVLAYLVWPSEPSHALKDIVRAKLGTDPTELRTLLFKPLVRELTHLEDFSDLYYKIGNQWCRKDLLKEYHREDILNVDRLYEAMVRQGIPAWFSDVEMPLTRMLYSMERSGCPLDLPRLTALGAELKSRADALSKEIGLVNPNSKDQIAEKLKEKGYELDRICSKTPSGEFKIDASFLRSLVWKGDAWAQTLLDYRRIGKILTTYVEPFQRLAMADGRLHGSFNQAGSEDIYGEGARGTNTGRLSSSNPNLQNISARTAIGRKVRECFVGRPQRFMFDSDLKQIEPRKIAHYSQSPRLIHAFNNGLDTHGLFGSDIFGKPVDALTHDERFIGKTSWLATVYGCSAGKLLSTCESISGKPLARELYAGFMGAFKLLPVKSSRFSWGDSQESMRKEYGDEAEDMAAKKAFFANVQDRFKKSNPEIMGWREAHVNRVKRIGYVVTYGGRKIKIDGLDSKNKAIYLAAERTAVNYQIQGSAADIMKLIMLELQKRLIDPGYGNVFAVVHDEALGDLVDPSYINIVKECMEKTVTLRNVPVESDTKLIANWSEKK